jgi:hypothetical protein
MHDAVPLFDSLRRFVERGHAGNPISVSDPTMGFVKVVR